VKEISFEKIIIEKYKEGDRSAFSTIFSVYYTDLVMFAITILNNADSSQEIVQDMFVKLWEDREKIVINTSLKSFLLKSVQNKCLDLLRHQKIKERYSSEFNHTALIHDYDTEGYVLRSELEFNIEKILNELPAEIAESFRLNRYEGLKYHEIAERLRVSQRTVEVRISKALQVLRERLKDYFIIALFAINQIK